MKNIFVYGFFPDRNRVLFETLCRHFQVITFREQNFQVTDSCRFTMGDDLLPPGLTFEFKAFAGELCQAYSFTEKQMAAYFPDDPPRPLPPEAFELLYDSGYCFYSLAEKFRCLADSVKIDMVVVNADYDAARRTVVVEAKKRGIPTLSVEHGHRTGFPTLETYRPGGFAQPETLSDFVNLDNGLEIALIENLLAYYGNKPHSVFLDLGAPEDVTYDPGLSREAALGMLGLDPGKFTLTVAGTWEEARKPDILQEFLAAIDQYRDLFQALARLPDKDAFQIIYKPHPAFYGQPDFFDDIAEYVRSTAEEAGVKVALIATRQLREILSATDLMVTLGISSLLWDNFLAGKPAIFFPSRYWLDLLKPPEEFRLNKNPLYASGCIKIAGDQAALVSHIQEFADPACPPRLSRARDEILAAYKIKKHSREEVSENICRWISSYLDKQPSAPETHGTT